MPTPPPLNPEIRSLAENMEAFEASESVAKHATDAARGTPTGHTPVEREGTGAWERLASRAEPLAVRPLEQV